MTRSDRHHLIYADGSCLGNPGPGGWGVVLQDPDGAVREYNGSATATTNNRMEMTAAIEGLRATEPGAEVVLRSDSQYVIKTMNLRWKRNANKDLWELLDTEAKIRHVQFEWVRGHDSDPINHRADELAVMGAKGRLVADGSNFGVPPSVGTLFDQLQANAVERIVPMLKDGEKLFKCWGCGYMFVTARDDENFCSNVRCQVKARRP
ncbi:MAG: ribonuclease H [Candidatus Binatus sp.]|uniref:ribonuclease H family protein n=1 Tax=Candidatus Binatus sp. TaxID=2811406 RepID=UPI0027270963|nr:ribonuclease H [Candidatus Binatus sp.]MDO8434894.1 ribonuclease H [Candidatus Binatus sp.]